ncbi:MAG: outer membrane lipoprotein carrier protein LolA [Acidobacteria bacterium]|nr:outer membrane lipoprotein carrier protein LolA [Acidobacteriaceae bacterium]MBV9609659.1 outer membrane lipoprotein carrier protein LolA [Acidobacteriota bacterium]
MRKIVSIACSIALLIVGVYAQTDKASSSGLDTVLNSMDKASANFRSAEADFTWDLYEKVVDSTDTQKGKIYFRRNGNQIQMAAEITEPASEHKNVLYDGKKLRLYQPKIDQVTEYDAAKNRSTVEAFLVLGFGGRGHDLQSRFDVSLKGTENVMGVEASKLDLVPKDPKGKNIFSHILLWIDPARGISVQQQFFEPNGNYRLAKYSDIKLNQNISADAFKLKTTGRTKVVNSGGGF